MGGSVGACFGDGQLSVTPSSHGVSVSSYPRESGLMTRLV